METNCDVTCSQLDSTISSATSLMVQNIIVNPHPLILKDPKKISILKKWEKKFKDGNNESRITVKLENRELNLNPNVTHYVINDINDSDMHEAYSRIYSTPLYESLIMGAWVINFQWITDCLKKDEILNEEDYQVRNIS